MQLQVAAIYSQINSTTPVPICFEIFIPRILLKPLGVRYILRDRGDQFSQTCFLFLLMEEEEEEDDDDDDESPLHTHDTTLKPTVFYFKAAHRDSLCLRNSGIFRVGDEDNHRGRKSKCFLFLCASGIATFAGLPWFITLFTLWCKLE